MPKIKTKIKLTEKTFKSLSGKSDWFFKFKEVPSEDGERYIEGYASTDDIDRVDDIVTLEALKAVAKMVTKKGSNTVLFNHDRNIAIGKVVSASVDNKGLFIKVLISKADDVKDVWTKIKEGVLNSFSINFRLKKYEIIEEGGKFVSCKILEIEIFEISVVTVPCNTKANITSVIGKSFTNKRSLKKMATGKRVSMKSVLKELLPTVLKEVLPSAVAESIKANQEAEAAKKAEAETQKAVLVETLKSLGFEVKKPETKKEATGKKTVKKSVKTKKEIVGKKKSLATEARGNADEEEDDGVPKKALKSVDDDATVEFVGYVMGNAGAYAGLNTEEKSIAKALYYQMAKSMKTFNRK